MAGSANQVPFGWGKHVTAEAVATEAVYDFGSSTYDNLRTFLGNGELKKFPVVGGRVSAFLMLDYYLCGYQ